MNPQKKKYLGQHFLHEKTVAERVANSLQLAGKEYHALVEVGPGEGSLTTYLLDKITELYLLEIDVDLIENLKAKFPSISANIHHADFLKMDLKSGFGTSMGIIGNYPYNISSQILIKTIENRDIVPEMVGMFQKEVAERVTAKSGSKTYGRISVMVNAFYHTEYLFKVGKGAFSPPPKVDSAVIRLTRKDHFKLNCNERLFSTVVAASFNQRRKTIKNALKPLIPKSQHIPDDLLNKRAEQLSVDDFIKMTNYLDQKL